MSNRDDIETTRRVDTELNRRKVLSTATAAAGVTGLTSAVASAEDDVELTEARMKQEMADEEVLAVRPPAGDVTVQDVTFSPDRIPADTDMLVGRYKSASVPGEDAFRTETYREWLQQDAPPGFENEIGADWGNDLYVQHDLGTLNVGGYSITVGFGFGLKVDAVRPGLSATASVDMFLNGGTVTILSAGVSYGSSGVCVSVPIPYLSKLVDGEACLDYSIDYDGSQLCLDTSVSFNACVGGGCPIIDCQVCSGLSSPTIGDCIYI